LRSTSVSPVDFFAPFGITSIAHTLCGVSSNCSGALSRRSAFLSFAPGKSRSTCLRANASLTSPSGPKSAGPGFGELLGVPALT
jgi:hypothetical protein